MRYFLIDYFSGTDIIEVHVPSCERFLTLCRQEGIPLESVKLREGRIRACIRRRELRRAEKAAEKLGGRIEVIEYRGFAAFIRPLLGRHGFAVCAALCFGIWLVSTLFVWNIEVSGCENISERDILSQLEEKGLKKGAFIPGLDRKNMKLEIMTEREDLAYIIINIKGTCAEVEIREKRGYMQEDEGVIADIISDKDGIVEDILVFEGEALVKRGDTVIKGDRLVSSRVRNEDGTESIICPEAEITLRTWRKVSFALSSEIGSVRETGREKSLFYLELRGGRRYPRVIEKKPFACYYKTEAVMPFGSDSIPFVPFRIVKETYKECHSEPLELSEEKCRRIIEKSCGDALSHMTGGGVIKDESFEYKQNKNAVIGTMRAECVEKAGVKRQS